VIVTSVDVVTEPIPRTGLEAESVEGRSPWALAWRRLRRNRFALAFLGLFFVIVIACLLAPVYASRVAHTGPNDNHISDQVRVNGVLRDVVSQGGVKIVNGQPVDVQAGGVPIGPLWFSAGGRFVLGADGNGRDYAVRLLYGGRNSLLIGILSAFIAILGATLLALASGYYGGWPDWLISRYFDILWAFPVLLLAIALGTALSISGFHHFGLDIQAGSLWIPIAVISFSYIPYVGRPLRGQILALRQKEFVEAAVAQGAGTWRIMLVDLLPNVASVTLVMFTLAVANNIGFEAALSYLGAGVQPPNPSWGTMIAEGQQRIVTAPWLTLVPGLAIVLTILALNVFGEGLRDALDPRAKVRVKTVEAAKFEEFAQ
jgi:peptide/nickel transport system permease protein